ncbi:MAG: hypothetical protein IT480_00495 [Gammaproteobacteria bacterium]|nr:hypothetical protein [Gammaproteobacteria bacterium]
MTAAGMTLAMTAEELERAKQVACARAIRAERAFQLLAAEDEMGDALLSAAWLALWRAEERLRALEQAPEALPLAWRSAA